MIHYHLFLEQWTFGHGSTTKRPYQRTIPITTLSEPVAVKEATDFVEGLFLVGSVQKVVGHLQKPDGTVLQQINVFVNRKAAPSKVRRPNPLLVHLTDLYVGRLAGRTAMALPRGEERFRFFGT